MNKKSDSINIAKWAMLSILTLIIILNINTIEVEAYVNSDNNNSKINLFSEIYDVVTGTVLSYEVRFNEEIIGYIRSDVDFTNIEKLLEDKYIKQLYINEDLVLSFNIEGEIILNKERVNLENLNTEEEIANKIYELSKLKNNDIKLTAKYLQQKEVEVNPSTLIIPTEDMYLGESKVIEGETGLVKQVIEVISENNTTTSTKIVKEDTIKSYVSKVIYRGTKNPYEYGVAFLNQPTRGGYLTSAYGERWNSFHKGIDIAGDIGDDVLVALDGEVIYAEFNDGGYGNLIIVKHDNDMMTYYGHLNEFYVNVGDIVNKGFVIGAVGNTGFSTGPHLHFELRVNNNPVDPYEYIIQ